jgi:phosphomannomutase
MQAGLDSKGKKIKNVNKMDGVRFNFNDGWILIRRSGTSPYLRISGESSVSLESTKETNLLAQEKMKKLDII